MHIAIYRHIIMWAFFMQTPVGTRGIIEAVRFSCSQMTTVGGPLLGAGNLQCTEHSVAIARKDPVSNSN